MFARTARAGADLIVSRSVKLIVGRVGKVVSVGGVSLSLWVGRDGEVELPTATRVVSAKISINGGVKVCEVKSTTLLASTVATGGINWGSTPVISVTLQGVVMSPCNASCE